MMERLQRIADKIQSEDRALRPRTNVVVEYVDTGYRWKDRNDVFHKPKDMETRHVFFTLCMIWNHAGLPPTHDFHRYEFGPYYTVKYMMETVVELMRELRKRTDIKPEWSRKITHMRRHLDETADRSELQQRSLPPGGLRPR